MTSRDTAPEAQAIQQAYWSRIGPVGRAALAATMSEDVREISRGGIRRRHPEYSEQEVELALRRLLWGSELFAAIYPGRSAEP